MYHPLPPLPIHKSPYKSSRERLRLHTGTGEAKQSSKMAALSVGDTDSGVRQEFHELRAFMNDQYNMTTSVVFDPQEELFWVGTNSVSKF